MNWLRGLTLLDAATGATLGEIRAKKWSDLEFSGDGKLIASARGDVGGADVWDVATRRRVTSVDAVRAVSPPTSLSRSALTEACWPLGGDGVTSPRTILRIVDVRTGAPSSELDQTGAGVGGLEFSQDGRLLVVDGLAENVASLWDVASGTQIGARLSVGSRGAFADLSSDGRRLLMTADNGEGAVWDIDPESWARRACAIANRTLTREGVGRVPARPAVRARLHVARGEEVRMHANDGALLGRRLKGAKGLALLGAAVLMGALLVSIDDGSASDGASAGIGGTVEDRTHQDEYRPRWSPPRALRHQCGRERVVGAWWKPRDPVRLPPRSTSSVQRPAWSPDGRTIAFVGMDDDGNTDVYVVGADGLGQQRLTRHPGVDGNPAWSPDGRKIAFTRRVGDVLTGKTHIYVMNADGSGQRRLTRGHVHFSVAWSPDGQKMLFERGNPRHPDVGPVPGDFPRSSTS